MFSQKLVLHFYVAHTCKIPLLSWSSSLPMFLIKYDQDIDIVELFYIENM